MVFHYDPPGNSVGKFGENVMSRKRFGRCNHVKTSASSTSTSQPATGSTSRPTTTKPTTQDPGEIFPLTN